MAFQTSVLPSIAAVTTDLWPSMANTLMMPFRAPSSPLNAKPTAAPSSRASAYAEPSRHNHQQKTSSQQPVVEQPRFELPDFLRDSHHDAAVQPARQQYIPSHFNIRTSISSMSSGALLASNPVIRRLYPQHLATRSLSTFAAPRAASAPLSAFLGMGMGISQRRTFQSARLSRNQLAHMEESANRNPTSATAQNAFYQALLKANMPAIIIERYNSGRFASNLAADEAYQKAIALLGPSGASGVPGNDSAHDNLPSDLSATQLQAVKQALAARSRGGNIAVTSKGGTATGGKDGPLYVVVDETMGSAFFRWFKFLAWFCLSAYLSLVVITMAIDSMSLFKRPGGRVDSEVKAEQQNARFTDVHGCDEAKDELQEMVDFLRNPGKFSALGGKLPKGVLLVGPPGTGKTLLARAVAGEAGVPFFYMSGSEFDEVYVGVGAKRVRELFAAAKAKSPSIVFIDELDAIGGRRNARDAAYVKQTLNQLLTELDGFDQNSQVIIIGATNFPQLLDKALVRPGRFDRHVQVELPDVRGRLAILKHHAKKIKAASDVDLDAIARTTSGLSGAELENIVNQAAVHASRAKAKSVAVADFDWAKDKVIMGAERRTMVITPKEKEMTAYHEAGHALMMLLGQNRSDTLYKVTVLARGPSLGHTAFLPEMDKYSFTTSDYRSRIDVSLGGKLAEEIVYGVDKVTSGASSDLQNATSVAFDMVTSLGMSSKLGNMDYKSRYASVSSETKALIEAEVQTILAESYERGRKLLTAHRKELDLLAKALVDYETLSRDEVEKVIRGEKLSDRTSVPKGPMVVPIPRDYVGLPVPGDSEPKPPATPPPAPPPGAGGLA